MDVTLTLTSTTTVGVVCCVHGQTTNRWSDVQVSAATSLAELSEMPERVAGSTDSAASLCADPANLATLQPNSDISDLASKLVLRDNRGMRASAAAEHRTLVGCAADTIH